MSWYALILITALIPLSGWIGMVRYEAARGYAPPRAGLGAAAILAVVLFALLAELDVTLDMPVASWWQ